MFSAFKRLFHRPAIQLGRMDGPRLNSGRPLRNTRFVSFLNSQGSFTSPSFERHDARLRRRKAARSLMQAGGAATLIWVAIESARALTLF